MQLPAWADPAVAGVLSWITIAILLATGGVFAVAYFMRRSNKID